MVKDREAPPPTTHAHKNNKFKSLSDMHIPPDNKDI